MATTQTRQKPEPVSIFVPLTKVDETERLVYGIAALEQVDKAAAPEVMDYETSKPFFQAWSSEIQKASGGKSLGNVRAMHGRTAAGKLTSIDFADQEKQVVVCAKVVDDNEWEKVREGVYTGFSVGGSYANKWADPGNPAVTRYTAKPVEISLVDNPCMPGATFTAVKADGTEELRKFTSVQASTSEDDLEKASGGEEAPAEQQPEQSQVEAPEAESVEKAEESAELEKDTVIVQAAAPVIQESSDQDAAMDQAILYSIDDVYWMVANALSKLDTLIGRLCPDEPESEGVAAEMEFSAKGDLQKAANEQPADTVEKAATRGTEEAVDKAAPEDLQKAEDGTDLRKVVEVQQEALRKATDRIGELEAKLEKLANTPLPGGPVLNLQGIAGHTAAVSAAEKALAPDAAMGATGAGAPDWDALSKMVAQIEDPATRSKLAQEIATEQIKAIHGTR